MAKIKQNKQRFVEIIAEDGELLLQLPVRKATPASMIAVGDLQHEYTNIQQKMMALEDQEGQVPWELSKQSIALMVKAFELMIKEHEQYKDQLEDLLGDDFNNWGDVFSELLTVYSGGNVQGVDEKKQEAQEATGQQQSPTW